MQKKSVVGFRGMTSGIRSCRIDNKKLKEMVSQLEEMLGEWSDNDGIVSMQVAYVPNELEVKRDLVESQAKHVEEKFADMKIEVQSMMDEFREIMESL